MDTILRANVMPPPTALILLERLSFKKKGYICEAYTLEGEAIRAAESTPRGNSNTRTYTHTQIANRDKA